MDPHKGPIFNGTDNDTLSFLSLNNSNSYSLPAALKALSSSTSWIGEIFQSRLRAQSKIFCFGTLWKPCPPKRYEALIKPMESQIPWAISLPFRKEVAVAWRRHSYPIFLTLAQRKFFPVLRNVYSNLYLTPMIFTPKIFPNSFRYPLSNTKVLKSCLATR